MNKLVVDTDRYVITNILAYIIFLLVVMIGFMPYAKDGITYVKIWAKAMVFIIPLIIIASVLKRNDKDVSSKLTSIYFWATVLIVIVAISGATITLIELAN